MPQPDAHDDALSSAAIKLAVRGGTRAVAAAQIAGQGVSIVSLAVLYRLIGPEDYGLLGMVLPVLFFLRHVSTLGLNVATIQRRELPPEEISSLFWVNLALGCAVAVVAAAIAPGLGRLYDKPELAGKLSAVMLALSGTSVVAALAAQHQALLERRLRLGRLAFSRLAGQTIGAAAGIAAALAGWGVWALVAQVYVELAALAVDAWWAESWRPMRPGRGAKIGEHLRMGGFFATASLVFFIGGNLDKLLVGRLVDAHAVGLYSQAYNLAMRPVFLMTTPLAGIALAALARARHDRQGQAEMLAAFFRLVGVVLFPVGIGLALVGDEAMRLLGGPSWAEAGPILSVLGLAVVAQGFINLTGAIFAAAGQTRALFAGSVVVTLVLAQAYVAGWAIGRRHGEPTLGVAWGFSLATIVAIGVPYVLYALWATEHRAGPILRGLARPAAASIAMGAAVVAVGWRFIPADLPPAAALAAKVVLGAAIYLWLARIDVRWLWTLASPWPKEREESEQRND